MAKNWRHVALSYTLLAIVLLAGAYLRLANLRTNPGWYPDEGSDLNIAWNLWHGYFRNFAVDGSLLLNGRAPLVPVVLGGLISLFGYDVLVARLLCAGAGIATIPLLFLVLKDASGKWQAITVSALFAVFPLAVLYNRWAFDYDLLMPLTVLCFWALLRVLETRQARWLLLAGFLASLSIVTAWVALALVIPLVLVGWFYSRRALLGAVPLACSLPAIYFVIAFHYSPAAFTQDFALTFSRTDSTLIAQFISAEGNYAIFLASNYWLAPAVIGLFLIEPRRVRALVLLVFFVSLFFVLRFASIAEVGLYRILGLLPFLAMGLAFLLYRGIPFAARLVSDDLDRLFSRSGAVDRRWWPLFRAVKLATVPVFMYLVVVGVLFFAVFAEWLNVSNRFVTRIDDVLAVPPGDALAAIAYVNAAAQPEDVVLASPQIGWALRAHVADFQQTLSFEGFPTENYPIPIRRDRFVFDPTPANARFAIVDPMWRDWAPGNIPAMTGLLAAINRWPIAFQAGDFVVYRNPKQ